MFVRLHAEELKKFLPTSESDDQPSAKANGKRRAIVRDEEDEEREERGDPYDFAREYSRPRRVRQWQGQRRDVELVSSPASSIPFPVRPRFPAGGDADYFADEDDEGRMFGGGLNEDQKVIFDMYVQFSLALTALAVRELIFASTPLPGSTKLARTARGRRQSRFLRCVGS